MKREYSCFTPEAKFPTKLQIFFDTDKLFSPEYPRRPLQYFLSRAVPLSQVLAPPGTPGTAGSDFVEGLGEVGEDVVDVLGADAEADGTGVDGLLGLLLGGELRVGGRGGMDYEALDVGYVGKE